nr:unnamed protein product [Digitaria exilis]
MVSGRILVRFVFLVLHLRSYVAQSPAATSELQQPPGRPAALPSCFHQPASQRWEQISQLQPHPFPAQPAERAHRRRSRQRIESETGTCEGGAVTGNHPCERTRHARAPLAYSIPPMPPIAGAGASSLGISTMMDSVVSLGGDPPPFLGGRQDMQHATEAGTSTHSGGVRVAAEEAGASARGGKGDVYCGQRKKKQVVEA